MRARLATGLAQRRHARACQITEEMRFAARREGIAPDVVRDELAAGRALLPADVNHPESEPMVTDARFAATPHGGLTRDGAEPHYDGSSGRLMRRGEALSGAGALGALASLAQPPGAVSSAAAPLAGFALTRISGRNRSREARGT